MSLRASSVRRARRTRHLRRTLRPALPKAARHASRGPKPHEHRTDPATLNTYRTGPDERGHFGIYGGRFVAETLMPLILDLERAYAEAQGRSKIPGRDGRPSRDLCRHGRHRSISPSGSPSIAAARRSISSARSSITPARTRSTMCSARSCWRGAWARRASSPRPAPACMASPPQRCAPSSACPASSTWARWTSSGRSRTCSA